MKRRMTVKEIVKYENEEEMNQNQLAENVLNFLKDYDKKKFTKRHIDKLKEHLLTNRIQQNCWHKYKRVWIYVSRNFSYTYLKIKASISQEYGFDVELGHLKIGSGEKCPIIDIEQIKNNNKWCLEGAKERIMLRKKSMLLNKLDKVQDTIDEIKLLKIKLEELTKYLPERISIQNLAETNTKINERHFIKTSN